MNITKTGVQLRRRRSGPVPYGVRPDQLPRALFVAELFADQLVHIAQDSFRGSAAATALARLGAPVMVRSDGEDDEIEALVRLRDGSLALIDAGYGDVRVDVAASTRGAADAGAKLIRDRLRTEPTAPDRVPVVFWMRGDTSGDVRHREIEAPAFDAIAANYPCAVRSELGRLLAIAKPEDGRLILWRGAPGTGKSHALRALARAWAPWCSAHFILDPGELLGRGGAYLLDVLSWDGDDKRRWRLIVLEDAGELIAADARATTGEALSRLLNVTDGLLGQGTNTLLLITTNEPLGRLHPAALRPGRCLANIEFGPFPAAEADAWLAAHGVTRVRGTPATLAELFNGTLDEPQLAGAAARQRFGFARALDDDPTRSS
jgi:hypothetical protein